VFQRVRFNRVVGSRVARKRRFNRGVDRCFVERLPFNRFVASRVVRSLRFNRVVESPFLANAPFNPSVIGIDVDNPSSGSCRALWYAQRRAASARAESARVRASAELIRKSRRTSS
jgi:hypothetical protein